MSAGRQYHFPCNLPDTTPCNLHGFFANIDGITTPRFGGGDDFRPLVCLTHSDHRIDSFSLGASPAWELTFQLMLIVRNSLEKFVSISQVQLTTQLTPPNKFADPVILLQGSFVQCVITLS